MYEFRCTENGIYYYDPILRGERFASNTLLFLIGYARAFGDNFVSDKLFLPNCVLDSDGVLVALTNLDFQRSARTYLTNLDKVEITDVGDVFDLYGLTLVLEQIGFLNYYQSTNTSFSNLNRVPHIPLFTHRSQDYTRIYNILTRKEYWGEGSPDKGNPNLLEIKQSSDSVYPLYSVYNREYHGDRAESLELYDSFGSLEYMDTMYSSLIKPVNQYDDMCSWFVWDSLSFTSLYHFSLGALYGMSQLGYGVLPYTSRPTVYAKGFKYLQYIDEAFFWFQNTPLDLIFPNDVFYVDAQLFRINTYSDGSDSGSLYDTNRILSSSVDQDYLYNSAEDLYSVDGGDSWITLQEFSQWAYEHNGAYPVTDYTSGLYRNSTLVELPLSDWEWPEP